jgi:hypothetical protein
VIDVILIWQALLTLPVVFDDRVENLDPLLKAGNMIFGDVSWPGAFVELSSVMHRARSSAAQGSIMSVPRSEVLGE